MLFYVQAAFLSCVSASGLWSSKHAQKASGALISELVVFSRWGLSSTTSESLRYGGSVVNCGWQISNRSCIMDICWLGVINRLH